MRVAHLVLLSIALLVSPLASSALAAPAGGRSPLKVRVKRPRKRTPPGETAILKVKVRNRTREEQSVTLTLSFTESDEVFATEPLVLAAKERRKLLVPVTVPEGHFARRLPVTARLGDSEDDAGVRVAPDPEAEWKGGRELFLASCSGCHGADGADIREEGRNDWLEAVREGEDDMPPFPELTSEEVRAMRMYVLDPRVEDAPKPKPGESWLRGREVFLASCSGCHGETGEDIREEDLHDWLEAVRDGEDRMPPIPGLTESDVRDAREYVQDPDRPAPPPTEPPPPDPTPSAPTYEGGVKAVLDASCVSCHKAGLSLGGVRADTYSEAFANRSAIVDSVEMDRMPTSGPLSQAAKDLLRSWLDAGAPER